MKFIITRTSDWNDDEKKPCREARRVKVTRETFLNSEKCIIKKKAWAVDIYTLEELTKFMDKHANIIIMPSDYNEIKYGLEIYDDWRE